MAASVLLYAIFRGIVASPTAEGFTLALPIVIAMLAYFGLHMGIKALLRLIAHRKTEILPAWLDGPRFPPTSV